MCMAEQAYYYFGSRNLRLTTPQLQGTDVEILQALLNMLPDNMVPGRLKVDGVFGPITRNAVRNFQKYFGLVRDGIVGPETFLRLGHRTGKYAAGEAVFSSRTLKRGSLGGDVTVLQNRLAAYQKPYLNRPADGLFGYYTDGAVQLFQAEFPDLSVEGIVGPDTFPRIFIYAPLGGRTLRLNDRGLDVYWLQYYLYQLHYYKGEINGYLQSATSAAVKAFQTAAGITADGIVGPQTWLALGASIPFPQQPYYYRVESGDSVYKIARLFKKNTAEIIEANHLTPPDYIIKTGQLLLIPPPLSFHLAEIGETLADVAAKYSLSVTDLQKANNLLPEGFLIPDEKIVLPGYSAGLSGNILLLQPANSTDNLIKLDPASAASTRLASFTDLSRRELFLRRDRKAVALLANDGRQIIIHDLGTGTSRRLSVSKSIESLDWSYDGSKMALNNGQIISAEDGRTLFSIAGTMPQWYPDNKNLLYLDGPGVLRKVNIETENDQLVLELTDYSLWFFRLAAPVNKLLVMGFADPGRVTFTFLYDLNTKTLQEISRNDFFGQWSNNYSHLLLLQRDYFGEFFPWFYLSVNRYSNNGMFAGQELYSKDVSLNPGNFSPSDRAFLTVLSNPATFYPIPVIHRDVYAKTLASRLLTQLTQEKKSYSPVWL